MARNNTYFFLSGFIALLFFALIFIVFIMFLFHNSKINTYALNKNNFIFISLDTIPVKKTSIKKSSTPKTIQETSTNPVEDVDVNDLFSDVWTKKIKITKTKKKNNRRIDEIQKKIKISNQNSIESLTKKSNIFEEKDNQNEDVSISAGSEVNEYLAKIQAIVYKYFHVPANSQGHSVKAVIELNSLGKVLDFRILNYSSNAELNAEVDKIKARLQNVIFPVNPTNKSSRTIVILKSKE